MKRKIQASLLAIFFAFGLVLCGAPSALAAPAVTVKYECADAGITNYGVPLYLYGAKLTASNGVVKLVQSNSFDGVISFLDYRLMALSDNMAFRAVKLKAEGRSMSEQELSDALSAMRSPSGYAVPGDEPVAFTLTVKPAFAALARTDPYWGTTIATTTVKNELTGASVADSRTPSSGNQAQGVVADVGETVTVTPAPILGWRFKEWSMRYYPYALGTNYVITGFSDLPAQCGAKVDPVTNAIRYTMPEGNVVAMAMYEQGTVQHTLKFNLNGGASNGGTGDQTLQDGDKAARPPDPSQSGFSFDGWYTDDSTFQHKWDFNAAMNGATAETITLYAKWTRLSTERTLSFSAGSGGSGTPPSAIKLEEGTSAKLPANTFVKAGHLFGGWKAGVGGAVYKATEEFQAGESDAEFSAQWLKNDECSLQDVSNSLLGVTAGNAQSYRQQLLAALEPLRSLITQTNAIATVRAVEGVEALYKSAFGITVTAGGAAGTSVANAAFSAGAQNVVALTIDTVAEAGRKALPAEFALCCVAALDVGLRAGGVAVGEAALPVVISMPLPASLKGTADIRVLLYGSRNAPEAVTPAFEGDNIVFALKEFGHVYIVGSSPKPGGNETAAPPRITAFKVNGILGSIDDASGTISLVLPSGTDLSAVKPEITAANAVWMLPASGTMINLSMPVKYVLTSQSGEAMVYVVSAAAQTAARDLWDQVGQKASAAPLRETNQTRYGANGPIGSTGGYDKNGYPIGMNPNVKPSSASSGGASNKSAAISKGTVAPPSQDLLKAFKKLGKNKGLYEIKNAPVSLGFAVGKIKSVNARLMQYDEARGAFIELGRGQWTIAEGMLVTDPLPPGVYGVLVK